MFNEGIDAKRGWFKETSVFKSVSSSLHHLLYVGKQLLLLKSDVLQQHLAVPLEEGIEPLDIRYGIRSLLGEAIEEKDQIRQFPFCIVPVRTTEIIDDAVQGIIAEVLHSYKIPLIKSIEQIQNKMQGESLLRTAIPDATVQSRRNPKTQEQAAQLLIVGHQFLDMEICWDHEVQKYAYPAKSPRKATAGLSTILFKRTQEWLSPLKWSSLSLNKTLNVVKEP